MSTDTSLEEILNTSQSLDIDHIGVEQVPVEFEIQHMEFGPQIPEGGLPPLLQAAEVPAYILPLTEQIQQIQQAQALVRRPAQNSIMAMKSKCPVFSEEDNYHSFKLKTQAFLELTDIAEDKRGLYLGLNALPANIQQRFLDENPTATLKGPNSEKVFWDFLGGIYEKDPLMEMCTKMKEFMGYVRPQGTVIKDYISEFEARYQRAIAKQLPKLPGELLMFMLLEGSKIPEKDKRLIMVEVNFLDKTNIFQNTKNSMMKLFAGIITEETSSHQNDTKVFEALYNRGAMSGGRGNFRPAFNQRFPHPRGSPFFRGYGRSSGPPRFPPLGTASGGGRHPGPSQNATNPPLNGKPRACHQCGSFTHFIAACPELNGWPTFYAGMSQAHNENGEPNWIGPDGNVNDYLYGAYTFGQEDPDQSGNQGDPQGAGQEGYYQVDTSGQHPYDTESMIGQAAAISLRETDQTQESKTYFNTYTCLVTRMAPFLREALNKIYLDTGCVLTVSGTEWTNNTLKAMSDDVPPQQR